MISFTSQAIQNPYGCTYLELFLNLQSFAYGDKICIQARLLYFCSGKCH